VDQVPAARSYSVELLNGRHDISNFACGNSFLDAYLIGGALEDQRADNARTYVLLDTAEHPEVQVSGYFTLKAESYYVNPGKTVPVVELAYLARHIRKRSTKPRIGPLLLIQAFRIAAAASDLIGISGMQLAATMEGRRLYEEFSFGIHHYGESWMFRSMAEIRQLLGELDDQ
jgi:hypothetical protein